ncbi:AAA family ATPase [Clostridium sp. ZS2-4]|uniref:AAA family ATPase n=1 Tax=Clostridium sp. ZS2-4 TaxID=2987703 RepID=UPI00227BE80A|nr:AAA family ATPase [Clostridium sp. ZS2-4]MCY6354885.1 AAA family ATPase [Clostridium sp. ZS2-4]
MLQLKGYEINKLIYEGKDTLVYSGYSKRKKENIILKTVSSERITLRNIEKLKHEYRIIQKVNCIKGVLKAYSLENWEGRPVLIREEFIGNSLKSLIKDKGIQLEEFFEISIQIVDILNEIHKNKVIHLDINPNNILINNQGEIKIIDFGNSMLRIGEEQNEKYAQQVEGTLEYISPEQTGRIGKAVDYRADYYSMGVCFYQLLTGKLPFNSSDRLELIYAHIAKEAVPPAEVNDKIPQVISNIVMKLIAKMPEHRYQTLIGLKRDLERCKQSFKANCKIEEFEIGQEDIIDKFQIPAKLYGREEEIEELLASFEKVSNGGKQLVLVKGYAGVGKTALVNEIQNQLAERQAYFISGKFEQFQSETPYSAVVQAFEKFINKLLIESSEQLTIWRKRILQAVGNNGKVLTDVLPSLKLIIGEQEPVLKLGASETQNRFNIVFENFIKVIAQKENLLVMFIDDLQWADSASLNFIKMLMTNESIQNLLIIGAYRDNEVDLLHPVMIMENELLKNKTNINIIELKTLKKKAVQSLLEGTLVSLKKDLYNLKELSDFIYNKTQGNCFFMKEFLKVLYDKKYIWFDYELMQWCWDTEEIKKLDITENVVEFLIKKIKTLNTSTIEELKNAACIGNQFDLKTLTLINNKSLDAVLEELQLAADEGLIAIVKNKSTDLSKKNIKYRFLHDRIQQAVYSLIPNDMKQGIHLHIGRLLLKEYMNSPKTEQLFEIVRQLNVGRTIIIDKTECIKLAELNLKVGMEAKSSSAYKSAFNYFKTGIEMLSCDAWQEYYELTLQLYSELTEMSYLISDYEQMDKFAETVLQNAKTLTDKVKIYDIKIQAYQAQLKLQEALKTGISVLKLMGINMPLEPKQTDIEKSFDNVKEAMEGMEAEDLLDLPSMSNPLKLAAMEIMLSTIPTTYKAAPMLTPILTCKMVELSIKYGNSPLSAGAYAFYGMILCEVRNDIEMGYRIGIMSINLVESQNLKQYKAKVLEINNYCIKHWKEHLKSTLDSLTEGFRAGMENGDFEYGAYCLPAHAKNSFYIGRSLKVVEEETAANTKVLEKIKQGLSLNYERIFGQLVLNMQGKSKNTVELTGEMCDENKTLTISSEIGDMIGMFFIFLSKTILYYHFGEYSLAVKTAKKAEENLGGVAGMVDIAVFYWYDSLSRLAIYPNVSNEQKEEILIRVSENQTKMKNWSECAPMNFLHKFYLVEAERLRVIGKTDEAIEYYDKSISLAKEYEYINDEALANELATKFWLGKNKYRYAKLHFKEAYFGYKRWGAEAKVKDLQNKYLEIFHEKFEENINENQTTITTLELVDINTIMKASKTISQEIVFDELIKNLIKIAIENVGAQKVVFIMKEEDGFIIKGKKEIEEERIAVDLGTSVEEYEDIPRNIINYVSRTNENVILENSIHCAKFGSDKYIIKRKPKSVLCFPLIKQRELKGIIYLENNLMTGAFTRDRLKVLEILSSQIIIALENAKLYKNLEYSNEILDTKVKERTVQLKQEKDKLQKYLDVAEVVFWVLDKDEKISLINRKGCELLGYSEEELLGKKWHENFINEKDREKLKSDFEKTINGQLVEYFDTVVITKTGEERMISCHNVVLTDKEGNVEGTLSCGVDSTEYNLLREQLQYSKLKLEFFANLSHELKTPLNLSFCALQMLNLYLNNNLSSEVNEKFERYTSIIKQNNYRLLKLVNNIVDITKINANSFDLNLQNNDIVELIRKITYSVSDYVRNKNRILEFNSNIKSKIIACDCFNIERIMLNLLSNAIKFTDEGDKIYVNIYDNGDEISIVVRDTGIGIPKDKQKMIFERFRQVDKSFTRNSEGSGIGLTIVKLLVEVHDGEIKVESKAGEFTEFIVNLPVRKLDDKYINENNYNDGGNSLIDRIDIEFSDVYGL